MATQINTPDNNRFQNAKRVNSVRRKPLPLFNCAEIDKIRNNNPDVVLMSGKKSLHAHRLMLCQGSSFFATHFQDPTVKFMCLDDIDHDILRFFINYIYGDKIMITCANVYTIFVTANKLNFETILIESFEKIIQIIEDDNNEDYLVHLQSFGIISILAKHFKLFSTRPKGVHLTSACLQLMLVSEDFDKSADNILHLLRFLQSWYSHWFYVLPSDNVNLNSNVNLHSMTKVNSRKDLVHKGQLLVNNNVNFENLCMELLLEILKVKVTKNHLNITGNPPAYSSIVPSKKDTHDDEDELESDDDSNHDNTLPSYNATQNTKSQRAILPSYERVNEDNANVNAPEEPSNKMIAQSLQLIIHDLLNETRIETAIGKKNNQSLINNKPAQNNVKLLLRKQSPKTYIFGGEAPQSTLTNHVDLFNSYSCNVPSSSGPVSCSTLRRISVKLTPMPLAVQKAAADIGCLSKDDVFVVGGETVYTKLTTPVNIVQIYNTQTDEWRLGPPLDSPLSGQGVCSLSQCIYVVGGDTSQSVQRLDTRTNSWQKLADTNQEHGSGTKLVAIDNAVYVVGGASSNSLEQYDPAINKWKMLQNMQYKRSYHGLCVWQDNILAIGSSEENYKTGEVYSIAAKTWTKLPVDLPFGWSGGAVVSLDGNLVCFCGLRISPCSDRKWNSKQLIKEKNNSWLVDLWGINRNSFCHVTI